MFEDVDVHFNVGLGYLVSQGRAISSFKKGKVSSSLHWEMLMLL